MNISPSKENILKKIRKALSNSTPLPFPHSEGNSLVFQPSRQELEVEFAEQFTKLQGKFAFCLSYEELAVQLTHLLASEKWSKVYCREEELIKQLQAVGFNETGYKDLESCDVSITTCECLVARTGSMILSAGQQSGRSVSVYAPVHICIARTSQLVYDIKDGIQLVKDKYGAQLPSLISLATGPSRTADIEKTLVVGVHGPGRVYVFLVDE
ncbi:MAG: LUD domain-containing protein [Chitinophagaceae bacterium]